MIPHDLWLVALHSTAEVVTTPHINHERRTTRPYDERQPCLAAFLGRRQFFGKPPFFVRSFSTR